MRNSLRYRSSLVLAISAALLAGASALRADIELPRYHLVVGQELAYQGRATAEHQDHPQVDITDTSYRIWVVRENPDHSFHLIVMSSVKNGGAAPAPAAGAPKNARPQENMPVVTVSQVDLTGDGDTPDAYAATNQATPEVFPPLPHDQAAMNSWDTVDDETGQRTLFKALRQRDRNEFSFEAIHAAATDPIYQAASTATYHFDWTRGLITGIETQFSQGFGTNIRGRGTLQLQRAIAADPDFIKQLSTEGDIYFAAVIAAGKATDAAALDPAQTEDRLAAAAAALKDAEPKITLSLLKDQLAAQAKAQPEAAKYIRESAKHRAELLAAAPLDWSTTDLVGRPATAQALRGRVLVLNFWTRSIPWCITQLPALGTLQADFKNDPVVVLGMNTGDDPKDAQALAQQLGLPFGQLKGDALANQLKIDELPTVLVIDQTGRIRDIYTGFNPRLRAEVGRTVRSLLAPAATK